jgi:hypothetical protein
VQRRFSSAALLLLAPLAAVAGENEYWSYTYRNVEVTAAGNSAYAVNLARYCVRLDGMLTRILGIKTSNRPPVHLYALPPVQVRQFLGDGDRVSFRISPAGTIILMSNVRESDSDYWGAYYGYTAVLLASDGRLTGPYWYQTGLPLVFASTKYRGDRAQLGTVEIGYAVTLGQGGALIPMRTFLSLKRATIGDNAATLKVYDAEAWGLAHEIFVEGWHRTEFAKYLELMRQGSQEPEAFAASFNMTYEQLDKEFANALRQRALVYTMDAPDPGAARETAQPLNAEEVKVRLALLAEQYPKQANESQ